MSKVPNRLHRPEESECKGCGNLHLFFYSEVERICGFCKRNGFIQGEDKDTVNDNYVDECSVVRGRVLTDLQTICEGAELTINGAIEFQDSDGFHQDYERTYTLTMYPGAQFTQLDGKALFDVEYNEKGNTFKIKPELLK
jgi:hypothetical protein